jgi:hypothetical protein
MAKRSPLCIRPCFAEPDRTVSAGVSLRPLGNPQGFALSALSLCEKIRRSPSGNFNGCIPHQKSSTSDIIRLFNDFHPQALRIYPERLRRLCGAECGTTPPCRDGPRPRKTNRTEK